MIRFPPNRKHCVPATKTSVTASQRNKSLFFMRVIRNTYKLCGKIQICFFRQTVHTPIAVLKFSLFSMYFHINGCCAVCNDISVSSPRCIWVFLKYWVQNSQLEFTRCVLQFGTWGRAWFWEGWWNQGNDIQDRNYERRLEEYGTRFRNILDIYCR